MRRRHALAACLGLALALGASATSAGSYAPPASDTQALELMKLGREKKSSIAVSGSKFRRGRAEIFVAAPAAQVKAAVLDFGNYASFIRKFQKSKVLKADKAGTEVYVQVPLLAGAASLWAVEKFGSVYKSGTEERIDGTYLKGNFEDLSVSWSWRSVDATHTVLALEIYLVPKIAAPLSLVNQEAQDACGEGILGVRDRAQAIFGKGAP